VPVWIRVAGIGEKILQAVADEARCTPWFLCLGKISVEDAGCSDCGARKADAQQRDSKGEGDVRRAVRFCCRPCRTRAVAQGRQGCPSAAPLFLALPPFQ